ncbi:MAG: DEAD/DEAH box helicase family protein, partial [Clostridiaceae bacterium]|nr:DEAD/DEAH box helicase family protein [Clostridiaceae bacterium]
MFELYPYQKTSVEKVFESWQTFQKVLLVLPTGCGKTVVFANVAKDIIHGGGRVLVLAHRDELIRQAQDKIRTFTGINSSIEKAAENSIGDFCRVTIGSVQTMQGERRLERFAPDHFSHIIIDEAHHVFGNSYLRVLSHFSGAKVLGVTATPDRGDKKCLGKVFEHKAYEYTLVQAIREGYLSAIKSQTIPLSIDISQIPKGCDGDYDLNGIATALDTYIPIIAEKLWEHCSNMKLLVFLPLRATARKMQSELERVGFRSYYAGGDDRDQLPAWNADGAGSSCCNAMLLSEGYDNPAIDAVCVLRLTKVRSLYAQMVGRGTRLFPGKEFLFIPDFLWQGDRHRLCRPANLIAPTQDIAELMMQKQDKAAEEEPEQKKMFGVSEEELSKASREVLEQREKKLAKELEAQRKKKAKLVDPIQYASSIADETMLDYEPEFAHDFSPPTEAQLKALEKCGILPDSIECFGKAKLMLDTLSVRRTSGLSSPRQIRCLERYGVKHAGELT